jgi:hypothetical protein
MIHCCMDNNRKQEIQNQIAELQRELAGVASDLMVQFTCCGDVYHGISKSLSDDDIIDAINNHPDLYQFGDEDVVVWCPEIGYRKTFHVTQVVSYNVTPF